MSDSEATECVLVRVFDLIASLDLASDTLSVSSPISQSHCCASQTLSFSEKRSTSGPLVREQSKRARISMDRPAVKAVPEAVSLSDESDSSCEACFKYEI